MAFAQFNWSQTLKNYLARPLYLILDEECFPANEDDNANMIWIWVPSKNLVFGFKQEVACNLLKLNS